MGKTLFQVYFHNPSDVPDYSQSSIKFSKSSHSLVLISTHISLTDDSIKSWTPKKRGCYYSNEKRLKYTKIYSYRNCNVECQVNNTERFCGCSPISRISTSIKRVWWLLKLSYPNDFLYGEHQFVLVIFRFWA